VTLRRDDAVRPREAERLAAILERLLRDGDDVSVATNCAALIQHLPVEEGHVRVFVCEDGRAPRPWTDDQAEQFARAVAAGIEHVDDILARMGLFT